MKITERLNRLASRLWREEDGQAMVEYVIIVAGLVLMAVITEELYRKAVNSYLGAFYIVLGEPFP